MLALFMWLLYCKITYFPHDFYKESSKIIGYYMVPLKKAYFTVFLAHWNMKNDLFSLYSVTLDFITRKFVYKKVQ